MNTNKPNGAAPAFHGVKLCGLYKKKRQKDGKTYLMGRCSLLSKVLILSNADKGDDERAPDFFLVLVEDVKEFKPKPAPTLEAAPDDF